MPIDNEWNEEFWKSMEPHFIDKNEEFDDAHILGYDTDGTIILWVNGTIAFVKDKELTRTRWHLLTGYFHEKKEWADFKARIISTAHSTGVLFQTHQISTGIWYSDGVFYLINGNEIVFYDSALNKFLKRETPVIDSQIVNFTGEKWFDINKLSSNNTEDLKIDLHNTFDKLYQIVRQWNFAYEEMTLYLTAFIMLAPLSPVMKWRPIVYLLGRRGVGKTTLLDLIVELWGPLAIRLDKASAYSIAQSVGNTSKIPILDEFENDRHVANILNLLKNTTGENGGTVTRGTIGKNAKTYRIKQMFWLASIYEATYDAAIESRMAIFKLKKHNGPLNYPTSTELSELRHNIIRILIPMWPEIEKKATQYRKSKNEYQVQDGRLIDNYAYVTAVADLAGFEAGIPEYLSRETFEEDENAIIDAILSSRVRVSNLEESIIEALEQEENVEAFGLKKVEHGGATYLAIKPNVVVRLLLKDTKWKNMDISAPLERIEGAKTSIGVKFNGRTLRAILIPWKVLGLES